MGYRIVRALVRVLVAVFYRRILVHGLDRVPKQGPLIVVANHHNGLVDPMILIASLPRRLAPVAKAPLFRHPVFGPFLRMVGALPVARRQDLHADPSQNAATLTHAAELLAGGGGVLIFPEGTSQSVPHVMPLRTGVSRMVLMAERLRPGLGVTVLPVGLVFRAPGEFRLGHAVVVVGDPVPLGDLLDGDLPLEDGVHRLTARISDALRALIVEADDRRTLALLDLAHTFWMESPGEAAVDRLTWMRAAMRRYAALPDAARARADRLRDELERIAREFPSAPASRYPPRVVAGYALREGVPLLLGLPLAFLGMVVHGLAYGLVAGLVRVLRPDVDTEATYKITAALVLFPTVWALEAWVTWRLAGPVPLVVFLVALVPLGFFALTWSERLRRARRDTSAYLRFLADRDLPRRLEERHRWIRSELHALAAEAPGDAP